MPTTSGCLLPLTAVNAAMPEALISDAAVWIWYRMAIKMSPIEIVGGILLLISSILIILIVMMQSGRESNMSASLTGGVSDSYLGKNQSRTREARLEKLTKILAVVFFVVTLVVDIVMAFIK